MKRAKGLEGAARPLEREIGTDHLDDVIGLGDPLDGFFRNK